MHHGHQARRRSGVCHARGKLVHWWSQRNCRRKRSRRGPGQGRWARGDFRPSAFLYWSLEDEDGFANLDLEYHLADGFALSIGGFWFEGYAGDPARNRFTFAGSLESSSNGYMRATAWF